MSWISQKEGIINHHRETDFGSQPIRVLHWVLIYMFQNTNSTFFSELQDEIKLGKIDREIDLVYGEEAICRPDGNFNTPRANGVTRKIELHETFLSYLWCCTYSIYVTFLETIDFPLCNKNAGREIYPVSEENTEKASEMFDYARQLIIHFSTWNKDEMPNPEILLAEKRDYVEQTNCFYTEAMKFILCHEYTHLKHHFDKIDCKTSISSYLEYEMEADNNAIDKIKAGLSNAPTPLAESHRLAAEIGVVIGILSIFFFKATTEGIKHPNSEDRLTNALERLDLIRNEEAWAIACVGLKFWDNQFGHHFVWGDNNVSNKDKYYAIIEQIKSRQNS